MAKKPTAYVESVRTKNKLEKDGFKLPHGYEVKKRATKKAAKKGKRKKG